MRSEHLRRLRRPRDRMLLLRRRIVEIDLAKVSELQIRDVKILGSLCKTYGCQLAIRLLGRDIWVKNSVPDYCFERISV